MDNTGFCETVSTFRVHCANGKVAELTIKDVEALFNDLMHHRLVQFTVNLDRTVMTRPVQEWESVDVHARCGGAFVYDDLPGVLMVDVEVNSENVIGGLPREEFRTVPKVTKAKKKGVK